MGQRKICFYIEQYGIGGVDTHLYSLINQWPETRDEIYLLTNKGNRGLELVKKNLRRECQIEIFGIPTVISLRKGSAGKITGKIFGALFPFLFIYQIYYLYKIFKVYHFDVLFCDNGSYPGGVTCQAAILAAHLLKIKHRYLLVHHWAIPRKKVFYLVEWFIDWIVPKTATQVIAVSNATKKTLVKHRGFNPDKIKVIYNGLETKEIGDKSGGVDLRRICKIKESTYLLGMLGNIESHKGHDVLLQALPFIGNNEEVHLCIIGSVEDDKYYAYLNGLIKNLRLEKEVTFTGFIADSSFNMLKQFDLLVMPTKDFEAFGYVLAEAMEVGTPVVASRVGAIPEVISDEENGLLVEPLDVKGLSEAILRIKRDKMLKNKIIINAKDRIRTKFTAHRMAEEFNLLSMSR